MPATIQLNDLSKQYKVPVRKAGLRASIGSLFKREYVMVKAVEEISFEISQGEMVGFLGPNGAGKTTTLKMLSGLLYPTHGRLTVLGYEPSKRQFVKRFSNSKMKDWWNGTGVGLSASTT
jgi:ABC-2 type transport system ATP-binding protein